MTDEAVLLDRRCFVVAVVAVLVAVMSAYPGYAAAQATRTQEQEDWLDGLTNRKFLGAPLYLLRFADGVYVLTKPIAWSPNPGQFYKRVEVPPGFVTDFASIPRAFWSILPPDGEYAYAAIVHDYLYWTQDRPREEADQIFKLVMADLRIPAKTIAVLHAAVRVNGGRSWESIARLKATGEKRILKIFPTDPTTRWQEFKQRPTVFVE